MIERDAKVLELLVKEGKIKLWNYFMQKNKIKIL
jgi:hypothetical protein